MKLGCVGWACGRGAGKTCLVQEILFIFQEIVCEHFGFKCTFSWNLLQEKSQAPF